MKRFLTLLSVCPFCCIWVAVALIAVQVVPAAAQDVEALAGVQSTDQGKQAIAFLPNELWVHAGDGVTWTFPTNEIHTVTFLKQNVTPQQVRPARPGVPGGGCPGTTPDGSNFNGSTCLTSSELLSGQTYTVKFPTAGNFKLVCLVHLDMTGVVHVLDPAETLPFDQAFYDRQAQKEGAELLSDASRLEGRGMATARQTSGNEVTAGIAEIVATTGGGVHTSAVMRFLQDKMVVHVGDTVEWTNLGPIVPHTVTFGVEPANLMPPSPGVTVDSDGTRHAVINSPNDNVNSGFLIAAPQERVGLAQSPLAVTRFRVTFASAGTYDYICGLHDDLGMVGRVIVIP